MLVEISDKTLKNPAINRPARLALLLASLGPERRDGTNWWPPAKDLAVMLGMESPNAKLQVNNMMSGLRRDGLLVSREFHDPANGTSFKVRAVKL